MLRDNKEEVNLLNSLMASNFSDRKINPWADKLGTHTPLPRPHRLIHHYFPQVSRAHCTFLCDSI